MKKIKFIIFILLIVFLFVLFSYSIFGSQISFLSVKKIKDNRKLKDNLINELKINNTSSIYDKNNGIFYYMVSKKFENKIYVLNIKLKDGFKYKIIDENLNIIKVNYNKEYDIIIYNDKYYQKLKIKLTNLPLINIITDEIVTTQDTKSSFEYINHDNNEQKKENIKIHVRGNTSKNFDKKSYKINIYDKKYKKEKEINLSNFYYGNSFILDAVYRDPSKIRNVLATELWNDISNDFMNIDIYSEFVELFINNEYKGLYLLTEPINRRKLNLKKTNSKDTSVVIKTQEWNNLDSNLDFSNITSDKYLGYELKYPNKEELYKLSWNKILSNIYKYYDKNVESSYETISSVFNIENYIDMIIFNAFINNIDNKFDKNNYFYINSLNDKEIFIQPWDMEYTFGIIYKTIAERNVYKNLEDYKILYTDFYHPNSEKINELLINRYWNLRKSILTKHYFDNLLNKYLYKLNKGAAKRDSDIWYEYDIEKEIEEVRTWIHKRINFFDNYVREIENHES